MRCWQSMASGTPTPICSASRAGRSSRGSSYARPRVGDSIASCLVTYLDQEIAELAREINALAKQDSRIELLCQIHGIGPYTAMLVIAEVGEIERFRSARQLCAWAGLTPTVRSSDGKARLGHISGQGSTALRWALIEAAQKTTLSGGPLREAFERIAKRRGRKIAKVAIARRILTLCYYGLRDGEIRCLRRGASARVVEATAA